MLKPKTILLPVDFPNPALRVIHQAAALARHFGSEIVMLHVATKLSHAAGVPQPGPELATGDIVAEMLREARMNADQSLELAFAGLTIRGLVLSGETAQAILQTASRERADLIMLPSYGYVFDQFLVGTVTPKMLHGIDCPLWTDGRVEGPPTQEFAIRNILCAVDFRTHSQKSALSAAQLAAEFSARLTLAHVTAGFEFWGPGGLYVNQEWKDALVADAFEHMSELLQVTGIKAEVFIGSGNVPNVLSQAVKLTNADVLVTGCQPYGGYLRTHGYSIISAMPIPVLSV